ncbi:MAG TPA: TetR/AcrR family transcriptional regulator [Sphingobium sp.]|uniref:TetR/AcrR family transcriptional regulator n=1 Tax=Sphingobium sp. TaxID=1912891 RepID=UPI002ED243FA
MAEAIIEKTAKPTLQDARKAFTRAHICDAARELFYREGYAATTFEQIAQAAGTRRTTLYSHFRDKAEILEAIGDEYHDGLRSLVEGLRSPEPTRPEIDIWIATLVTYVVQQRAPATLLIGLGIGQDKPTPIQKWSDGFARALGSRLPAFRKAIDPGEVDPKVAAWARVVLRELSLACLDAARDQSSKSAVLEVAADLFENFINSYK